ncbi:MAG: cysteine--tRNA ligase [Deltaproteobacteria bacterium]|nr:cysteine--tRNA ligase [Deltaproteobacteria bacterium]
MPAPIRLYNTLSRQVVDFEPIEAGKVSLYVCGMTVYDRCHVGHARAMVVFDAFVRYLRHRGWEVNFVRNFTDVDDKIIRRANELGEDPMALSQRYIDAFREDAAALGLVAPDHEPQVSTSIESITALIGKLVDRGHAYVVDGNVWFAVATCEGYGKLSGQKVEELRSADAAEDGKRAPADFALWKAAKPGEPAWPSPWGDGRPGWHIECSAMAWEHLGVTVDIHGGGLDLVFPHHENEVAQSECAHGAPYVRNWLHNGLLTMTGGQKMGKSLGNVINVQDALSEFPAQALRLYYLQNHYRSPLPWSADALGDALAMVSRLYEARDNAEAMEGDEDADRVVKDLGEDAATVLELGRALPKRLHDSMDDDFNTARALGYLFDAARAINRFANHKKAKKRGAPVVAPALEGFRLVAEATGLLAQPTAEFLAEAKEKRCRALGIDAAAIDAALAKRHALRNEKRWAEADAIRAELEQQQILVMDSPDGAEWRVNLTPTAG